MGPCVRGCPGQMVKKKNVLGFLVNDTGNVYLGKEEFLAG